MDMATVWKQKWTDKRQSSEQLTTTSASCECSPLLREIFISGDAMVDSEQGLPTIRFGNDTNCQRSVAIYEQEGQHPRTGQRAPPISGVIYRGDFGL